MVSPEVLQEHGHGADLEPMAQLTVDSAEAVNPGQMDPESIERGAHLETDVAFRLLGVDLDVGAAVVEGGECEQAVLAVPDGVLLGTLLLFVLLRTLCFHHVQLLF